MRIQSFGLIKTKTHYETHNSTWLECVVSYCVLFETREPREKRERHWKFTWLKFCD